MRQKTIIMSVFLTLGSLLASADNNLPIPDPDPDPDPILIPIKTPLPPPDKQRSPSNLYIGFSYDNALSRCRFTLPAGVFGVSITMEDEVGISYYGYVTSSDPYWNVTLYSGDYTIICDTDNGLTFEGQVTIL